VPTIGGYDRTCGGPWASALLALCTLACGGPGAEEGEACGIVPGGSSMLEMRPDCESCGADLPPDSRDARICSFECTFCVRCVEEVLHGVCPNCGGTFSERPTRTGGMLERRPGASRRTEG